MTKKKIPWDIRIDLAEEHGKFSAKDVELARSWVTCACGEQDKLVPRYSKNSAYKGAPKDSVLTFLGQDFFSHVAANKFDAARTALGKINRRAAVIIKKELRRRDEKARFSCAS